jgi:hypothetical protein
MGRVSRRVVASVVVSVVLSAPFAGLADEKVLVLQGNIRQAEFPVLEKFKTIGGVKFTYEKTADRALPGVKSATMLWIGQSEICENAYFLTKAQEDTIKSYVNDGGVVISVGQDSDGGRPCEVGWLPVKAVGIERGGWDNMPEVTKAAEVGDLFTKPNKITVAHFDDSWTQPDPKIILLATIQGGQDVGVGLIEHGKGFYLLTSLENENAADVAVNTPMMENLLLYAATRKASLAVDAHGKLASRWAEMKQAR